MPFHTTRQIAAAHAVAARPAAAAPAPASAASASASASASAATSFSGQTGDIAYSAFIAPQTNALVLVHPDGTGVHQIHPTGPGMAAAPNLRQPVFSPDGCPSRSGR